MDIMDLVIVGGGPAGLSTAVNASSEKIRTLLINGDQTLGGQAGTSSKIENYAGFPCGVTGKELAERMVQQARRFGTEMLAPCVVSRISRDAETGLITVFDDAEDADEGEFVTRAVVLATGVRYRRLSVPNLVAYLGNGVAYGSPPLEETYVDKQLFVVGGANSAGQAAVHLSDCPNCTVHVVVRGTSLDLKMSHYLIEKIESRNNIQVHTESRVISLDGNGKLERLVMSSPSGEREMPADQLWAMIGAVPNTTWLKGVVEREKGYVLGGRDLTEGTRKAFQSNCGRMPFDSETSVPGVFVVGDLRAGAVRRVAAAVGAGAMSIPDVHRHLASLPATQMAVSHP
jgi:thioredoxin reductase (NADPH)